MPSHRAPHHAGPGSRAVLVVLLTLASAGHAHAQSVSRNLWVADGPVNAMASLADTVYIGGSFTRVQPVTGGGMPVDLTIGLAVAGFPRIHGQVLAVTSDGAGGWFVGGTFDSVGNQPRANAARIRSDLSVSSWHPMVDDAVTSLTLSSGIVYLGGTFQNVNSTFRPWLAAVNATSGDVINSFNSHCDGPVYALGVSGTNLS